MTDAHDPLDRLSRERRRPPELRTEFAAQLDALQARLVADADRVAQAIDPVTTAFLDADRAPMDHWVRTDHDIVARCRDLEEACYLLLARQSPVAVDLRRVVATLRCTSEVQRSSNLLRHVGESLTWVHPPSLPAPMRRTISELGQVAGSIYAAAVRAWQQGDSLAAVELQRTDDEADLLQKLLLTEIYTGEASVEEAVSLALVARYYERIADHGVELARAVSYIVTGERVPSAPGA